VFAGFRQDVGACLAAADVVALPSLHEGLGVAALEAMAAGRPVVASRVGGLTEVVVDGETGLFAEPGEPESLATALVTLARDRDLRARLGEGGRRRVSRVIRRADGGRTTACYGPHARRGEAGSRRSCAACGVRVLIVGDPHARSVRLGPGRSHLAGGPRPGGARDQRGRASRRRGERRATSPHSAAAAVGGVIGRDAAAPGCDERGGSALTPAAS
jgi:hypothetical protein